ncbi:hypothetical protein KPATCC21470_0061 [Kitasatospora purpeofusca]
MFGGAGGRCGRAGSRRRRARREHDVSRRSPVGGLGRTLGDRQLVRRHTVAGRAPADCGQPAGAAIGRPAAAGRERRSAWTVLL